MGRKTSDEECLANVAKLQELFRAVVPESDRFTVVAGYGIGLSVKDFVVVRVTTSTYSNYAIGFDEAADEIVILPVDLDIEHYGDPHFLKKSGIRKAKYSMLRRECTIWSNSLPKKYISFTVQEWLNEDPDQVCILVKQEAAAKQFLSFFRNRYAK
jgi:hypothetical protein